MPAYDFHVVAYEGWKVDSSRSPSGVPIATYTYAGAEHAQPAIYGDLPKTLDFYESKFGKYRWATASVHRGADLRRRHGARDRRQHGRDALPRSRRGPQDRVPRARPPLERQPRTHPDVERLLAERRLRRVPHRALLAANDGPDAKKTVLRGYLTQALAADRSSAASGAARGSGGRRPHHLRRHLVPEGRARPACARARRRRRGQADRLPEGLVRSPRVRLGAHGRSREGALGRDGQGPLEVLRRLRVRHATTPRSA